MKLWRTRKLLVVTAMSLLVLAMGACIAQPSGQTALVVSSDASSDDATETDEHVAEAGEARGELPSGPIVVAHHEMLIDDAPAAFTVVQRVLAFAPGAWAPPHYHGGHVTVTILDGEFTNRMGDDLEHVTVLTAGDNLQEPPGQVHSPGNATEEMTHVFASFAMPADAAITTVVDGMLEGDLPPGPSQLYVGNMEVTDTPDEFTFVQLVLDFSPETWTPNHYYGGDRLITVIAGEMTRRIDGVDETYGVGESWSETAGEIHAVGNMTDGDSRVITTIVLPKGVDLTTVVE